MAWLNDVGLLLLECCCWNVVLGDVVVRVVMFSVLVKYLNWSREIWSCVVTRGLVFTIKGFSINSTSGLVGIPTAEMGKKSRISGELLHKQKLVPLASKNSTLRAC